MPGTPARPVSQHLLSSVNAVPILDRIANRGVSGYPSMGLFPCWKWSLCFFFAVFPTNRSSYGTEGYPAAIRWTRAQRNPRLSTYSPLRSDKIWFPPNSREETGLSSPAERPSGVSAERPCILTYSGVKRDVNGRKTHYYTDDQHYRLSDKESVTYDRGSSSENRTLVRIYATTLMLEQFPCGSLGTHMVFLSFPEPECRWWGYRLEYTYRVLSISQRTVKGLISCF